VSSSVAYLASFTRGCAAEEPFDLTIVSTCIVAHVDRLQHDVVVADAKVHVLGWGTSGAGELSLAAETSTPLPLPLIEALKPKQIVCGVKATFIISSIGKLYSVGTGLVLGLGKPENFTTAQPT